MQRANPGKAHAPACRNNCGGKTRLRPRKKEGQLSRKKKRRDERMDLPPSRKESRKNGAVTRPATKKKKNLLRNGEKKDEYKGRNLAPAVIERKADSSPNSPGKQ